MIEWAPLTQGYTTYFILGSNIFFLGIIHLFDSTYLSNCFNHIENMCKIIKFRHSVQRTGTTSGGHKTLVLIERKPIGVLILSPTYEDILLKNG